MDGYTETVQFYFRSARQRDAFIGELQDGFGESFVEVEKNDEGIAIDFPYDTDNFHSWEQQQDREERLSFDEH